jgi:hypothetical protein
MFTDLILSLFAEMPILGHLRDLWAHSSVRYLMLRHSWKEKVRCLLYLYYLFCKDVVSHIFLQIWLPSILRVTAHLLRVVANLP